MRPALMAPRRASIGSVEAVTSRIAVALFAICPRLALDRAFSVRF